MSARQLSIASLRSPPDVDTDAKLSICARSTECVSHGACYAAYGGLRTCDIVVELAVKGLFEIGLGHCALDVLAL
jgi:hypothetical protein